MLRWASVVTTYVIEDVQRFVGRTQRKAISYGAAGLLILSAYAAALFGCWFYLEPMFGPAEAAFVIAGATIALAAIILVSVWIWNRIERKRHHDASRALAATAAVSIAPILLRSRSPLGIVAAGGLGFLAAQLMRSGSDEQE